MEDKYSRPAGGFQAKHLDMAVKHFPQGLDEQTTILKSHLMLEQIFRDFCGRALPNPKHLQGARLTFKQIALLTRSLDPHQSATVLWPAVNHLNSLRNAMAHDLEPDEQNIAKLKQSIIAAVDNECGRPGEHDFPGALGYMCGVFSAHLHYLLDQHSSADEGAGLGE